MQYDMFYVYRCEESRTHTTIRQTAHTDAYKTYTAYTTVFLKMNPRGSKSVGDNRN